MDALSKQRELVAELKKFRVALDKQIHDGERLIYLMEKDKKMKEKKHAGK